MKAVKVVWVLLTFVPIILIILGYLFPSTFFSSQESIRSFVEGYGAWAPLAFVVLQIIQVVITPLSHYTISVAGGFIFGTWYGFLLNWIGRIVGTAIAFYIGRFFGRKIIEHVVKKNDLEKYDECADKGVVLLFLAYFLPLFPDDELSYLAGVSSLKPSVFLTVMALGHIGGSLGLAYIGNGITSNTEPLFIILSIMTLFSGLLFIHLYKKTHRRATNSPRKS